ncbi:MAG TPA: DNA replication and repair protein RecF [Ignavibacteriaceae bacterium]|nr:DNA replication and repair protein RecF [Ignavibacteriaceae bacterium]
MILSSINLKNFRSHKEIQLKFSGSLNYIVGGNGQGKTSILEAIYYLCTTRSNSSKSDSEVVRFNENEFEITGFFFSNAGTGSEARVFYSLSDNKKFYFQNNKHINRAADVIGKYPVVLLTPADHSITQGSPGDRRKFVDSVISQASDAYLKNLLDYNRTLRHRSSLLAGIKENRSSSSIEELEAWSEKLVKTGSELIRSRIKFVNEFDEYISVSYKRIMEDAEIPKLEYTYLASDSAGDNLYESRNIEELFSETLAGKRDEEIRRGINLVGPHRDDFIFEINGLNLRMFGSQGQHKTFQVILRFAEFFYLKEITGKAPIFLLDDVFGELDASRSMKISGYLREVGQAFITITDFANFSFLLKTDEDTIIKLSKGEAVYA